MTKRMERVGGERTRNPCARGCGREDGSVWRQARGGVLLAKYLLWVRVRVGVSIGALLE